MNSENVSATVKNLEAAFAGESMANRKYLYFARRCRELGADDVAGVFEETARQETAHAFGHLELLYPSADIGVYIQPVHQGVGCHCEFILPLNRENSMETTRMEKLFNTVSRRLFKQGAFFSRPYGIWADLVYNRNVRNTIVTQKVKEIFDPNNVMNPGKLCF